MNSVIEAPAQPALPVPTAVPSKGLGIAALVVGIVSVVFGLVPLLALFALAGGVVALVLGLIAARNQKRARASRGIARAGWVLGAVAVALGVIGFAIVDQAVDDLQSDLNELEAELDA